MVDEKDLIIIKKLENNARTSFTSIAKELNVTEAAIRKRVKKLENEGVILNYKANINYKKLGFKNKVIMGVDTDPNKYLKVINKLREFDFIKHLNASSGDHMIMFEIWIKNLSELQEYLNKINSIDGVKESCPSIIHDELN
jgi:Lrp/AsnC family transcriptional regulator for asnA, asnC and gidA